MTGAVARAIWECAAEPARRELARMRVAGYSFGAQLRLQGALETLRAVKLALIERVLRDEDGALAEISRELIAMQDVLWNRE